MKLFNKTTSNKLTVANAVTELQTIVTKLTAVVEEREYTAEIAQAQIKVLEEQIKEDRAEVTTAKNIREKIASLLS